MPNKLVLFPSRGTSADSWTFVRAEVRSIADDRPILHVQSSREFSEKSDGEIILKILKRIVAERLGVG